MDEEKPTSLGRIATRIVCTLVGLVLLYFMSCGPAVFLAGDVIDYKPYNMLFINPPLYVLRDTPLRSPYVEYLNWWSRLKVD